MRSLANTKDVENGIVAIKFFAEWCGPCGLYRPVFERAAARNPSIEFYEVDVDKAPEIAAKYGIMSLPTTVILKDGEVVQKAPGAKSSARLEFLLTDVLDS